MPILIDTDVIIDYLRGQADAVRFIESQDSDFLISTITIAELFTGVREGRERQAIKAFLNAFEIVVVSAEIAELGGLYRRDFHKSHSVSLADALIAASAITRQATLVTLNKKHFPMVGDICVPYRKS